MPVTMPPHIEGLGRLSVHLMAVAGGANRVASHAVRKASLVAGQAVVTQTPVDTGRAKGNWVVGIDSRNTSSRGDNFLGGSEAMMNIATETQNFNAATHSSVHISNNLPYIVRLNEGWSMKADPGFVEDSMKKGLDAVKFSQAWVDAGVISP